MKQWRLHFPVIIMSRVLRVSRSGFYTWLKRKPSRRTQEDARLKVAIKAAHKRTREVYGARRLQPELAADGFVAGRDRIARLRRKMGIRCRQKRKFKATTNSNHNLPVAENLLEQTFTASAPNEVWLTDITYITTGEGWLYLAGISACIVWQLNYFFSFQSNSVVMAIPGVNERYTGHFSACISWYWKTISFSSGLVERW